MFVSRRLDQDRVALLAEPIVQGRMMLFLFGADLELNFGIRLLEMDLIFEKSRISI